MSLCTQGDVETRLQISLTNDPEPVVTDLIAAATGLIQDHCDQQLEDQPDLTATVDGSGAAWVFLHETPVRDVTSVTEDGVVLVEGVDDDYLWYTHGALLRIGTRWSSKPGSVVVVYDAGYETIPETLKAVCASMVARALQAGAAVMTDETDARTKSSESTINYSVSYEDVSVALATSNLYVSEEDTAALAPYVRPVVA